MTPSKSDLRRVVITGLGVVSPLGVTTEALWDALISGRSGAAPYEPLDGSNMPMSFAAAAVDFTGAIDDFGPLESGQKKAIRKALKLMCRETQMGVAAAQRAIQDAQAAGAAEPERAGVVFGSDYMLTNPHEFNTAIARCVADDEPFNVSRWASVGIPQMSPLWLLKYLPNMPASHLAIYNDLRGPNNSITLREAAGNLAIGEAFRTIRRGHADLMIAGATGTRVHPMKCVHAVQQDQVAAEDADPARVSRPFDLHRSGMVIGEGAGAVVLEELGAAQARGATIYGEILGAGSSCAAERNGAPKSDTAMINTLRATLAAADARPNDVGHLHAHGLSTTRGDALEAIAIQQVFADRAEPLPVTAAKSYFGNLGAGGGVVELVASLLALRHGRLFPILNYETPDPDCPVHAVRSTSTPAGASFVNLNVTPQGQASAVMVRRLD